MTSNPTIFQKAIEGSADYDEEFRSLVKGSDDIVDDYWAMVLQRHHRRPRRLRAGVRVVERRRRLRSVEVAPRHRPRHRRHDAVGPRSSTRRINRPNLMVKIPGTAEGVPAIRQMISEGRNINVTLIFSLKGYEDVLEAYVSGLEHSPRQPVPTWRTWRASAASSSAGSIPRSIAASKPSGAPDGARASRQGRDRPGQAGLPVVRAQVPGRALGGARGRGARVQRPLWASTSTKNPAYPDTLYVDNLIGPDTVDTLPEATIEAFLDHGTLARTVDADVDEAEHVWKALSVVGVDLDDVAAQARRRGGGLVHQELRRARSAPCRRKPPS